MVWPPATTMAASGCKLKLFYGVCWDILYFPLWPFQWIFNPFSVRKFTKIHQNGYAAHIADAARAVCILALNYQDNSPVTLLTSTIRLNTHYTWNTRPVNTRVGQWIWQLVCPTTPQLRVWCTIPLIIKYRP